MRLLKTRRMVAGLVFPVLTVLAVTVVMGRDTWELCPRPAGRWDRAAGRGGPDRAQRCL